MSTRSRLVAPVGVFGLSFALAFGGAFLVVQNNAPADEQLVISTVPDTQPSVTTTTVALAMGEDTTIAETSPVTEETVPPDTEPPPTEAPTTTIVGNDPQITTDGAVMRGGLDSERRLYEETIECASLSRNSEDSGSCERVSIADTEVAWFIPSDETGIDIMTLEPGTSDVYNVGLTTDRRLIRAPSVVDITGDGSADLLLGWRDSENNLDLDVVEFREGQPVVTLHLSLVSGSASAGEGQLEAWSAIRNDQGETIKWDHWEYTKTEGRWVVDSSIEDSAPSGQFEAVS
jgi:hypothetical protein